ncbi:MAG: AMP-dependent synthetase/ligase [Pirellulaceae bacterium]
MILPHSGSRDALPPASSIVELFFHRVAQTPERVALLVASHSATPANLHFEQVTWGQLGRDVLAYAEALRERGIGPASRVPQLAANQREWIVTDLALQLLGAWHVPLHVTLTSGLLAEVLSHADPHLAIATDLPQAARIKEAAPNLEVVVQREAAGSRAIPTMPQLATDSQIDSQQLSSAIAICQGLTPQQVATLVYTSGTTGQPKGVMLSHENLVSNTLGLIATYTDTPEDRRLNFLPFSHVYARTCDLYTWIARGTELVLAPNRETIIPSCHLTQPTLINGVPYFFQKVVEGIIHRGKRDQPGILKQSLGGAVRMCTSGGAALPAWISEYFQQQELPLCQGYGLTETSPVITANTIEENRPGSVGRPLPQVAVRIAADGEVETTGPHVMLGYYGEPPLPSDERGTRWLATGDLGRLDADGYLHITGRKKELLVLSTGKKIWPGRLEELLVADPLIAQALVVGEGRKYLSALIVPDPDRLREAIKRHRLWVFSKRGALAHRKVLAWYRERIDQALADCLPHEQVRRFILLDRGFTFESGELTPKLSLRRKLIEDNFREEIGALYQGPVPE